MLRPSPGSQSARIYSAPFSSSSDFSLTANISNAAAPLPYLLLVLIFALGLMASPIVIAFPLALFLFDYWPLRYFEMGIGWRRNLYEKLPLIGLSLLAAATTFFVHKKAGVLSVFDTVPRMLRAENALTAARATSARSHGRPISTSRIATAKPTTSPRYRSLPSFSSRFLPRFFFSGA